MSAVPSFFFGPVVVAVVVVLFSLNLLSAVLSAFKCFEVVAVVLVTLVLVAGVVAAVVVVAFFLVVFAFVCAFAKENDATKNRMARMIFFMFVFFNFET